MERMEVMRVEGRDHSLLLPSLNHGEDNQRAGGKKK
jgi:hypothetical protein